ncbi:hypothetical protein BDB01DRAFT_772558 [Pilobolus umbonatus]|nr:hypothetical protein BDB01DRAFT_772558 [Pilobolus umbonatus]
MVIRTSCSLSWALSKHNTRLSVLFHCSTITTYPSPRMYVIEYMFILTWLTIPLQLTDVRDAVFSWTTYVLSDYISASIIPAYDDLAQSWKDGLCLLSCIHYHNPTIVPDLHQFFHPHKKTLKSRWEHTLSTAFQIAYDTYHTPILIDPNTLASASEIDEATILLYLVELIPSLVQPNTEDELQRIKDINHIKSILSSPDSEPSLSTPSLCSSEGVEEAFSTSTTLTSTYTLQQLKITKTTVSKYSDGTEIPSDLEEFESRSSTLTEKINNLQHRLSAIVPTRSSNYHHSSIQNSITSGSMDYFMSDDNISNGMSENNSMFNNDELFTQQQLVRVLHPLQAAEEDYSSYDRNFKSLQSEYQALTDGDMNLLRQYIMEEVKPEWREHPKVLFRLTQINQLHNTLSIEFENADANLSAFRRGFAFARMCSSIRHELDLVQNKMVKSITSHHDIEELEMRMEKTTGMVDTLRGNFGDLLSVENRITVMANESGIPPPPPDTAYLKKFQSIEGKNGLVQSWVDEVRIWFAEAERIRKWIEIRIDQLNNTILPDPLSTVELPATREEVSHLNRSHSRLEKEIEAFDKEDMARLRSHVKSLTGSGRADKDLSPADTTTIEITLTTLMTLDKLIHLLRKKSYDLQVLTRRVHWEGEYEKTMVWLRETDGELNRFLSTSARWTPAEMDDESNFGMKSEDGNTVAARRERLLAKEKQKEMIVQQLLTLEKKMSEFDQGQFTTTQDSFQDLDNTSSVELPHHLESRQDNCELFFENLMKRMTFARKVIEQRLNVMDFLYQTEMIADDTYFLRLDLKDAETKVHSSDNERDMTAKVQGMHERIIQLVTATANRIPYPSHTLENDRETNDAANKEINRVINCKKSDLILLSEDLDEHLHAFRSILQLHRRGKEYMEDAVCLCDWADERVKAVRRAKLSILDNNMFTIEDIQRLERDRDNTLNKLSGKENDVIDLLTRIQQLLETSQKLRLTSIDEEGLREISQQLEEGFDRLQQILEEYGHDLESLRKKMEDGNTYFENARSLRAFITEARHSMPALKQTCGFMTGQSEEQDKSRFEKLHHSLLTINKAFNEHQLHLDQLRSHSNMVESSKVDNMEEIKTIQDGLEKDWALLGQELKDFEDFTNTVGQWYDRQRRLSMITSDYLTGLNEEIAGLAKTGLTEEQLEQVENKINEAYRLLDEVGEGINSTDTSEDPLQTANYSCARDRHNALSNQLKSTTNSLKALLDNADKALAFRAFLIEADGLVRELEDEKVVVDHRMSSVGSSEFACRPINAIEAIFKSTHNAVIDTEAECRMYYQQLESLKKKAQELVSIGYDPAAVYNPLRNVESSLNQLQGITELEKKQAIFIRKIHAHAKTAHDLSNWIRQCSDAIKNSPTDICMNDEQEILDEIDHLEQKILDMHPTIQAFNMMKSKVFTAKDGSPIDLLELGLDSNSIRLSVDKREEDVLNAWSDLKQQLIEARQAVDESKYAVEIARKVKNILMQIGDMRDRINVVKIFRNTQLDEGLENRDLKAVLSCPLTSIPSEHRLSSAKAELNILDRDIDTKLQLSINELDSMLASIANSNSDVNLHDIFSDQRAEITVALNGLTDLMKTKRRAIAEAEKMEGFLTVMEEFEVLLLALTEVVARASPEEARMVDGTYVRSDLQALLIDLDTRYRYYEPKINELLEEAKQVAENLMEDHRVVDCLNQLTNRWINLQAEAASKKNRLMELIGPLGDTFDGLYATEGILQEHGRRATNLLKKTSAPILKQAPTPQSMQSTPHYMTSINRAARGSRNTNNVRSPPSRTGGTVSPTVRRVNVRQSAAQQQRQRVATRTPETYVADPKNDLDVALGNIVNDSPYKVQVKMVPGEVGKYWFGEVNPKLAYCRILRSRMVMVRVGGGWVELSQFLRDHALLEEGNYVSASMARVSLPPIRNETIQEGFFNTTTIGRKSPSILRNNNVTALRGGKDSPTLRESRSTPFHRGVTSPVPFGHGIKAGNKFLVSVDGQGNRVEVKMTKANSKDTKFSTPRRINI